MTDPQFLKSLGVAPYDTAQEAAEVDLRRRISEAWAAQQAADATTNRWLAGVALGSVVMAWVVRL